MERPFIKLNGNLPGITGLLALNPETGGIISQLAETLLRADNPSGIPLGERELIFASVSDYNECNFCKRSHVAFAKEYLGEEVVDKFIHSGDNVNEKLVAFVNYANAIASYTTPEFMEEAVTNCYDKGATEAEIHHVAQIAAFACFCNRYVDSLGTVAPAEGDAYYKQSAERIVSQGYLSTSPEADIQAAVNADVAIV